MIDRNPSRDLRPMPYDEAVRAIGAVLADHTHFVVSAPGTVLTAVGGGLARIPSGWTAYVDNGTDITMTTHGADVVRLMGHTSMIFPLACVVVIPKIVPAKKLAMALGALGVQASIPADGSQDILAIPDPSVNFTYQIPKLLLDAIATFDPEGAAAYIAQAEYESGPVLS